MNLLLLFSILLFTVCVLLLIGIGVSAVVKKIKAKIRNRKIEDAQDIVDFSDEYYRERSAYWGKQFGMDEKELKSLDKWFDS
jgi:hypothetical protein